MKVFAKTVETGSFSATADALSMSSQMVGKHVSHAGKLPWRQADPSHYSPAERY
jgi:hypothetical protein